MIFAAYGLRQFGGSEVYSAFAHPLLDTNRWLIADGGDLDFGPEQSLSALRAANRLGNNIFLGLKIRTTLDGHWVLYAPSRLEELSTGNGFVLQKNLAEILELKFKSTPEQSLLALATVFKEFPNARYYIEVVQPGATQLRELYSLIRDFQLEKRIVLTSQFMDTLSGLRSENAQWLTGTSTSERSKSEFMTSIFLETVMTLSSDVFILKKNNIRLITELERRKKIVVLAPDGNPDLLSTIRLQPLLGILTTRPSHFLQLVDSEALSH